MKYICLGYLEPGAFGRKKSCPDENGGRLG